METSPALAPLPGKHISTVSMTDRLLSVSQGIQTSTAVREFHQTRYCHVETAQGAHAGCPLSSMLVSH